MHLSTTTFFINLTYRSTVGSDRRCGRIRAVIQLQVVILAISSVIYAELLEGDRHQTTSGCPDEPLTVGVVTVGVWVVGTCKRAVVSKKSAAATCWGSMWHLTCLIYYLHHIIWNYANKKSSGQSYHSLCSLSKQIVIIFQRVVWVDLEGTTSTWPRNRLERWRSHSWSASRAGWKPGRWGWAGCRHTSGRWEVSRQCCHYGSEGWQTEGAVMIDTPVSPSSQQSGCSSRLRRSRTILYVHACKMILPPGSQTDSWSGSPGQRHRRRGRWSDSAVPSGWWYSRGYGGRCRASRDSWGNQTPVHMFCYNLR